MRYAVFIALIIISTIGCKYQHKGTTNNTRQVVDEVSFDAFTQNLKHKRIEFAREKDDKKRKLAINNFWVENIFSLYEYWKGTPWDFSGTTSTPQKGSIACGYFVTAMLQNFDTKLNRVKLSTCTSLEMMKAISGANAVKNLSKADIADFNSSISNMGKGVYIIGLDFHTGFIINDGRDIYFMHSNYIGRQGVINESTKSSLALSSSKTRWVAAVSNNEEFQKRWLK